MKRFFFFFLFILLSIQLVSAIGISPPRITENFQSGFSETYEYYLINKGSNSYVRLELFGSPLAEYVTLSEEEFPLPRGTTTFEIELDLPDYDELAPGSYGRQIIMIRASEIPDPDSGGFAAVTSIVGQLLIHVPVPGEYGEITAVEIPSVEMGQNTRATVTIQNRGTQPLQNKRVEMDIYDLAGEFVDTITIPRISLSVDEEEDFSQVIPSRDYESSKYLAEAYFYYDDEKEPAERKASFFIGSTDVELVGHTQNLTEGQINEIAFTMQSLWGANLRNVRGTLTGFDGQPQALPVIDFGAYQESTVKTFIEVPYLNESPFDTNASSVTYDTTLLLEYPVDETTESSKEIPITFTVVQQPAEVEEKEPITLSTQTILVAVVVVLVILLIIALLLILRKKK